jgi:chromosome segregation ATPase
MITTGSHARLFLDDLCQEVVTKAHYLRCFADEMDQIDAAIADKKAELAALHPQIAVAQRELERVHNELKKIKGMLAEETQARRDWVA